MTVRTRTNNRRHRATILLAGAAMLLTVLPTRAVGAPASERTSARSSQEQPGADDALQAEYDDVLAEEQRLEGDLERLGAERERMGADLTRLEQEAAARTLELEAARASLGDALRAEAEQKELKKRADNDVVRTRDRLRRQAVATFVSGGTGADTMSAILRAESITDADIALTYSRVVIGDTDKLLRDYVEARERREKARVAAAAARDKAEVREREISTLTAQAVASRDRQKALTEQLDVTRWNEGLKLQEIQGRRVMVEVRITAMNHASDGVQALLASLQADQPDFRPGVMTVTTPTPGYSIGSAFGLRHHPILGITRLHAGGDIGAPAGTPIHAVADGIVAFAGERGGYGNCVVIDHGNSLGTLYGHQANLAVQTGDLVARGDIIGWVGSTGLSTGPHLHLETRIKGVPVDPAGIVDFDAQVEYPTQPRPRN